MSFNTGDFVLNPNTNRLIKKNGALHLRILKQQLLKKETKKKTYKVQTDTEPETSDYYEPVKRVRKQAPKKMIGSKNIQNHFNSISDMSDTELSDMEAYIQKRLGKTKIEPEIISEQSEQSEQSSSSSSE